MAESYQQSLSEAHRRVSFQYPGYLANPPGEISAEDRARYENQQRIVRSVVATFENPKYDNGTEEEKQALKGQVQNLMNEVRGQCALRTMYTADIAYTFTHADARQRRSSSGDHWRSSARAGQHAGHGRRELHSHVS